MALVAVPSASGSTKYVDSIIGSPINATGTTGGLFNGVREVAVNDPGVNDGNAAANGDFYVVDDNNHRIQRFNANGSFDLAWGVDVVNGVAFPVAAGDTGTGAAAGFEICTAAAHCKAGLNTGGNAANNLRNGRLDNPQGVAVDQDSGNVYVSDRDNRRISQYTANGVFVRSFGWDVVNSGPGNQIVDVNEVQTVSYSRIAGQLTGGTFTLTFDPDGGGALPPETTTGIPYDASAALVDQRLEDDLANIDVGDVSVTGGPAVPTAAPSPSSSRAHSRGRMSPR